MVRLVALLVVAAACKRSPPTEQQLRVELEAPGRSSADVERVATIPLERRAATIEGVTGTSSVSAAGRATITIQIANRDAVGPIRAELARLISQLDNDVTGEVVEGARSRVVRYALWGPLAALSIRAIHDDTIRPRVLQIPGVVDVSTCGGRLRGTEVAIDASRLASAGVEVRDVEQAIRTASTSGDPEELRNTTVATRGSAVIRMNDIALVSNSGAEPLCEAFVNGIFAVASTVTLRPDADATDVQTAIVAALGELARTLPVDMKLELLPYDREAIAQLRPGMTHDARRVIVGRMGSVFERGTKLMLVAELEGSEVRIAADGDIQPIVPVLRQQIPDLLGIDVGAPTRIAIYGPELDVLAKLVGRAHDAIAKLPGVDIGRTLGVATLPELVVEVDRAAAARLGVPPPEIARTIAVLIGGVRITHDVTLRFLTSDPDTTASVHVGGVPLSSLVTRREGATPLSILREHGQRYAALNMTFRDDDSRSAALEKLRQLALPAGYALVVDK